MKNIFFLKKLRQWPSFDMRKSSSQLSGQCEAGSVLWNWPLLHVEQYVLSTEDFFFRKMVILVVIIFSKFNIAYYLILLVYSVNCRPHWEKRLRNGLRTIWMYDTFTHLLVLHLLCNSFLNVLKKKGNFFFLLQIKKSFLLSLS